MVLRQVTPDPEEDPSDQMETVMLSPSPAHGQDLRPLVDFTAAILNPDKYPHEIKKFRDHVLQEPPSITSWNELSQTNEETSWHDILDSVQKIIDENKELTNLILSRNKSLNKFKSILDCQDEIITEAHAQLKLALKEIKKLTSELSELESSLATQDEDINSADFEEPVEDTAQPPSILSDTWVCDPNSPKELQEAESMIMDGRYQRALGQLQKHEKSLPMEHRINAILLKVCTLRVCDLPEEGLAFAEMAVAMADRYNLYTHLSKAQMYRGLCLLDLGWYAEASWCFTRAANVRWFARRVLQWKRLAETMRHELPRGSEKRGLREEFQEIPQISDAAWSGRRSSRVF